MTLQQLEYIVAVDEYRHFGNAAEHCKVTQPTLSAMVQKLEDELGVKLFNRNTQPVTPTGIGSKVVKQAKEILYQTERITDIVAEEQESMRGEFHLAILPTIAPYLLPRFYPQFLEKYPELDIRIAEMKIEDIEIALANHEIDAAIIATEPENKSFRVISLFYEEFYGYVSPKEPLYKDELIRTSDIPGERLWLLDEGHCFRDQLTKFCEIEGAHTSRTAYSLGSLETFMRMVESGQGITIIPELALTQLNANQLKLVRPFAIPRPARQIRLVTTSDSIRFTLLNKLKNEIIAVIAEEKHELKPIQYLV